MTAKEIIERIAREKRVERMARAICKGQRVETADLVQIAYMTLCEKPAEWVVKAESEGWLAFWLLNLVKRLATERRGRYGSLFRAYGSRAQELTEDIMQIPDE